jgi:hypothetical protein
MGSVLPTCWFITAEGVERVLFDDANIAQGRLRRIMDAFEACAQIHQQNDVICYAW